MHGRKKSDLPQTKEEKDAVKAKIANYKKVIAAIRHKRATGEADGEYKSLLGKVLRLHPDYYSMWNFRKEVILKQRDQIADGDGRNKALGAMYKEELELTVDCIERNPKSYPAWHHRKWALERGLDFLGGSAALQEELALCGSFLELDGRNFHCWAHRMWVTKKMGLSAARDFAFTTTKILQNFSNYSAFHFRSKLLPRMVDEIGRDRWQLLQEELEISHNAMFTEPADQSVWWYHHFLLTWAEEGAGTEGPGRFTNVLRDEKQTLAELVEVEGRCKWAELALLLVTERIACWLERGVVLTGSPQGDQCTIHNLERADKGKSSGEILLLRESCDVMASRLAQLDPMHGSFYAFVARGGSVRGYTQRTPVEPQRGE